MWVKHSSGVWYPSRSPKEFLAIYINGNNGDGISSGIRQYARGKWSTQNFTDVLPPNCVAVEFGGTLILTHGLDEEDANLMIGFRATGETWDYWYEGQTIEAAKGSGQRSNYASGLVPVKNGNIDVWWDCLSMNLPNHPPIPVGAYPNQSSFGITLFAKWALAK